MYTAFENTHSASTRIRFRHVYLRPKMYTEFGNTHGASARLPFRISWRARNRSTVSTLDRPYASKCMFLRSQDACDTCCFFCADPLRRNGDERAVEAIRSFLEGCVTGSASFTANCYCDKCARKRHEYCLAEAKRSFSGFSVTCV